MSLLLFFSMTQGSSFLGRMLEVLHQTPQWVQELLVELAEPIQASLKGLRSVESKSAKAYTSLLSSDEEAGRAKANKELAFLHLVRWLQLYVVGDAENVDVDLADELANIYQSALSKSSGMDPSCPRSPVIQSLNVPIVSTSWRFGALRQTPYACCQGSF